MANRIRAPKDMGEVVDLIRRLPMYIRLVWALLRDGRVPAQQKLILVGIGAYVVLPIDLIPDFVPVLGQLDDLAVARLIALAATATSYVISPRVFGQIAVKPPSTNTVAPVR